MLRRDVAESVNHREDNQPEGQGNSRVRESRPPLTSLMTIAPVPAKTRAKVPITLCDQFLHHIGMDIRYDSVSVAVLVKS
jgi:hypothetical protein